MISFFRRSWAIGGAQKACIKGDFPKAKMLLDSVLSSPTPDYIEGYVHSLAGEVEYHLGNYASALQHLNAAMVEIRKEPNRWEGNEYAERTKQMWEACSAKKK